MDGNKWNEIAIACIAFAASCALIRILLSANSLVRPGAMELLNVITAFGIAIPGIAATIIIFYTFRK